MLKQVTDQMHRTISVPDSPQRIVSLVPSQTELLHWLGCSNEVVGQTLFCIHPKNMHQSKPRIGGTKTLSLAKIENLHPDLVIGNKEENSKDQIETLALQYPVWMSDIQDLNEALAMIEQIGSLVNKESQAKQLVDQIKTSFTQLVPIAPTTVLYLIWRKPWMAAGAQTFIGDMLGRMGLQNGCTSTRYPELSNDDIRTINPQHIFLSSEPYPFKEKHIEELKLLVPNATITLVDGELFSWYGSRLQYAANYFQQLIHAISPQSLDLPTHS
ncbi:MAG: helical backbone metal receptor [Bacteroidia bacterium]|jgi:ABC-type Fe3+-hydroxamate transport system substrate-binding protein|nr:helical backbone metal receptor [Bacteroidia bacterium]